MADGEIKSCLVICSNLMVSLPDNAVVQRALDSLDPLVVIDFFMSETAERADVVLPGSVWCEDEGTTTNLEGRVIKINAAAEPPGEARRDWEILCDLARRLGRGQFFPYRHRARDLGRAARWPRRAASPTTTASPGRRSTRRTACSGPAPTEDHPGTPRLFTERFAHPDGRARMFPIDYTPPAEEPGDDYPFRLTTGRVVYHYLSGTQTRRLGFLNSQAPEPWVEIHPQRGRAARASQTTSGCACGRRAARWSCKALVVPTIRPDTLFIPFHYGHAQAVNQLTNPAVEPTREDPRVQGLRGDGRAARRAAADGAGRGRRAEPHRRRTRRRCSRTRRRDQARRARKRATLTQEASAVAIKTHVRRSVALHRLPRLRGRLPRVRLAQGREHGHGRLRRPRAGAWRPSRPLHALRGSGRAVRAGLPGDGDPDHARGRGAAGRPVALHRLPQLRLRLPVRRAEDRRRGAADEEVQPLLRPHRRRASAVVRAGLPDPGDLVRRLRGVRERAARAGR